MAIKQSDLKLLWGRSGNRCANCKVELSFDAEHSSGSFPLGEQAHIVAAELDGPRGKSILTAEERDAYANLILLCPTDHRRIDRDVDNYPVEKLHQIKTAHELWVQTKLADGIDVQSVADRVYAHLIDQFVDCCGAERWNAWVSRAIYMEPVWEVELAGSLREFEVAVFSAVWPQKIPELERAFLTFASVIRTARETFFEHAILKGDTYVGPKFYKELKAWDAKRYRELLDEWEMWQTKSQALMFEATRAANWLADCARENINPSFFVLNGKFRLSGSVRSDLGCDFWIPEYTATERENLPRDLPERFANYKKLFPFEIAG